MTTLAKFFSNSLLEIKSAVKNQRRPLTYVIGFGTWKQYIKKYFPERRLVFLPKDIEQSVFDRKYRKKILRNKRAEVFIWGFKAPDYIFEFLALNTVQARYVEDGFIRSVNLGSTQEPAMSLCIDSRTPYFDASKPSDLEVLLQTYDFEKDPALLNRARMGIRLLLDKKISKYNTGKYTDVTKLYGPKKSKRILVLGQVEDDASIKYGCDHAINNNDLVRLARRENPEAQIIYKPHPDTLIGQRPTLSNPDEVKDICQIIRDDIALADAFDTIDHVYTITSQAGFEALLRGITVTAVGMPFYAGWGLTDDRQANSRRTRQLSIEEVFAGAYLLYPRYFNVKSGNTVRFETVVNTIDIALKSQKNALEHLEATPPKEIGISDLYNLEPTAAFLGRLETDQPIFISIPWIREHSDALISRIADRENYQIVPLDLFKDLSTTSARRNVARFARENPDVYRKLILKRLIPLRNRIKGVVFTFDWAPVARLISLACEELGVPRILVPHESVFVDKDQYYLDPLAKGSMPIADIVLGWGDLQREIYVERGYPASRFIAVGAPKLDSYFNYQPTLKRNEFFRLFGLQGDKKTVLFATQPMDAHVVGTLQARKAQEQAVLDVLAACEKIGAQLLVRLPPSKDEIFTLETRARLVESSFSALDGQDFYIISAEESLYHADLTVSINSTMLFEALLMGRQALSAKYLEFPQLWEKLGMDSAANGEELGRKLYEKLFVPAASTFNMQKAAELFSIGSFDGQAAIRIRQHLSEFATGRQSFACRNSRTERMLTGTDGIIDVAAIHSPEYLSASSQHYLTKLLGIRSLVYCGDFDTPRADIASVELFMQWGITPSKRKERQQKLAKQLGAPLIFIEDGFIRSLDIGLSGEPGLSIILDDTTAYYDATKPSRLERLLQSGPGLTDDQMARGRQVIDKIASTAVSKYNHAPRRPIDLGSKNCRKILIVDQRFGDASVASGLADEGSFEKMLNDALTLYPDADVIIKRHPDAIKGGKSSYYSQDGLKSALTQHKHRIHLIDFDINPYSLFDAVDDVFVVTSGMGFEALMANKRVHCYGAPFYAGWGVTTDHALIPRRTRQRTLEEIFHFAYIECSRYVTPDSLAAVQIEELIEYIVRARGW